MKVFILMALCLTAVLAEDFQQSKNIEKLHYGQHQQTVQEARNKVNSQLGLNIDGHSFEEIGSYGSGGSGVGTVGYTTNSNLASGSTGSSSLGTTASTLGLGSQSTQNLQAQQQQVGAQSHYGATQGSQFDQNQLGLSSLGVQSHQQLNQQLQQQLQQQLNQLQQHSAHIHAGFGGSSNLNQYIGEAERLAREQVQGLQAGAVRTGGSQHGSVEGLSNLGGVRGGGYQTKSWEKQSKWSTQSEFGSDGHVKNFKELSTGESENYNINGKTGGYKAATSTLDDNGKVSSYSLHT